MISKNLTLEIQVDHQRLLTRVTLLDLEAGLTFPIPLPGSPAGFKAVRTIFDPHTTSVVISNEGLQQLAEVFELVTAGEPPPNLELSDWEMKEVLLDRAYATSFAHGTGGHGERMLISKLLAYILDLGGDLVSRGTDHAINTAEGPVSPAPPSPPAPSGTP